MPVIPKPNFKRKAPKKSVRGNFSKSVRNKIYERDNGLCQQCYRKGEQIHHIVYRSQNGRGVYTNGLTLCNTCHMQIHADRELSDYWVDIFTNRYGKNFYKDAYDE